MNTVLKHPDVKFPPPVLFAAFIGIGWLLQRFIPLPEIAIPANKILGLVWVELGFLIILWSTIEFKRHQTTILPHKASSAIINSGPFKYSRNPIYFSFALIQVGAAVLLANLWIFLLLVPVFIIMEKKVIEREEAFLTQEFGEPYNDYKKQVRRWI